MDGHEEDTLSEISLPATRVAVIDDDKGQVARLIAWLTDQGYDVRYYPSAQAFQSASKTMIFPLQMIDYNLGEAGEDGFEVAKASSARDPWSVRILISNLLDRAPATEVVKAFGPPGTDGQRGDGERRSALTLVDVIGVRHFWACWDKREPDFEYAINSARAMVALRESGVKCRMDDALSGVISNPNSPLRRRMKVYDEVQDFGAQVAEVIRQLAWTPAGAEVTKMILRSNRKGRSRTFVAEMAITCKVEVTASDPVEVTIHQFIKIGRKVPIRREVDRALWLAGKVIGDVQQMPKVRRVGEARDLAGIAYEMVRSDGDGQARTLLECMFQPDSGDACRSALDKCLKVAWPDLCQMKVEGPKNNLQSYYRRRFRNLGDPPYGAGAQWGGGIDPVKEAIKKGCESLAASGLLEAAAGGDAWKYNPSEGCRNGSGRVDEWLCKCGDVPWTIGNGEWFPTVLSYDPVFQTKLCHGDLHLANVLIPNNAGDPWYIDFADTGVWPIAMDVVVMECAFRFQAIQFLPCEYEKSYLAAALVCIEAELMAEVDDDAAFGNAVAGDRMRDECVQWLKTVRAVLKKVRRHACKRIRGLKTGADQEHINYLYGLLSCALSCAALWDRQEGDEGELHRAWFAIVVFMLRQEWERMRDAANK